MDIGLLMAALGVIAFTSIVIMYACDAFEGAADFLGRNMKPGTKGATINAIGSSLPEFFTTLFLLFGPIWSEEFFGDADGAFQAGIATCAGSAVFNAVIIPGLCILAVMYVGVKRADGSREKLPWISLRKKVIIRDGFFFVLAEFGLIFFLADTVLKWWMGGALAAIYLVYITVVLKTGFAASGDDDDDDDEEEDEEEDEDDGGGVGLLGMGWFFDFNQRFFNGRAFTTKSAWAVLLAAVGWIGAASAGIAWAVEASAEALDIAPYFTAVILAAAATSVPDTVLSIKDALKGEYDDAVANAVGSNIFDICICLGIPLMIYGLTIGDVNMSGADSSSEDVQLLRWVLLICTAGVLSIFLIGNRIGRMKAVALFSIYIAWIVFIVIRAIHSDDPSHAEKETAHVQTPVVAYLTTSSPSGTTDPWIHVRGIRAESNY